MTQQHIGQYRILSELGVGGMGVVYRAVDTVLDREVAIKKLRSEYAASATVIERFRREAKMQARLNHPNIAQLYTLVQHNNALCIVMEYVNGTALTRHMPMPWETATAALLPVLEALEYAHRRSVLHRDIKPDNIMIDHEGMVKIMDFGIAHVVDAARLTREKTIIGTLEYISPERVAGKEIDARSDIYSVGVLFFEMLTGRLPFDYQGEFELLRSHLEVKPYEAGKFVAGLPPFIGKVINHAIAKSPSQRFPSCSEMGNALREGVAALGIKIPSLAVSLRLKQEPNNMYSPSQEMQRRREQNQSLIDHGDLKAAHGEAQGAPREFPTGGEISALKLEIDAAMDREHLGAAVVKSSGANNENHEILAQLLSLASENKLAQALRASEIALQAKPASTPRRIAEAYFRSRIC